MGYWRTLSARLRRLQAARLFRRAPAVGQALLAQRAGLVAELQQARAAYLAALGQGTGKKE